MNLVGKIFIVSIMVMSVIFMAFIMAVYATHKNWQEVVTKELAPQLKQTQDQNSELTKQAESLKQQFESEKTAKTQAVAKLESELKVVREELKSLDAKQAALEKAKREAVAAMERTQANATKDRTELDGQRKNLEDARKDRDANFKEVVRLTEDLNQAANEKDLLKKRTDDLAKDMAKADLLLRKFGLDKNKDYSDVPPTVAGHIIATTPGGMVEISIGGDQGLIKGHQLEVFRIGGGQSTYVGRIEVVKTQPDKAVCRIDPKFQNSHVMVGDRVASRIE